MPCGWFWSEPSRTTPPRKHAALGWPSDPEAVAPSDYRRLLDASTERPVGWKALCLVVSIVLASVASRIAR